MAKYVIDSSTLEGLANAIRSVTGSDRKFTPEEMIAEVTDILNATTFVLVDKDGNEYPAVYVDSDTLITATPNDIRKGTTAITSEGVIVGEKEIPAYHTEQGGQLVKPGESLDILMYSDRCQYTKLQVIVCMYNTTPDDSVAATMVAIQDKLYPVGSTEVLADVSVDVESQGIKLGIANEGEHPLWLRYMTIKEEP